MSSPITEADSFVSPESSSVHQPEIFEVLKSRDTQVGGTPVRRALPKKRRRTIGAWCFADHFEADRRTSMGVGPHPHIGLQTVTWLLQGELIHKDSLGSNQLIKPGQLNLMTAGSGVSHSEESTNKSNKIHGIQLWIAQPDATRNQGAAFEHHDYLPETNVDNATATVLVGSFGSATSTARTDTPLLGVEMTLGTGSTVIELKREFEYGIVVLVGSVAYKGQAVTPGNLAYFGSGRDEMMITALRPSILLLLGGEPFPEKPYMWWNFVARTQDELTTAYSEWQNQSSRFGTVASSLPRIEAPKPYWL